MTPAHLVRGEDGVVRCHWGAQPAEYRQYHDDEWGRPVHGDRLIFEKLTLEAFQSGLSWLTILRKREAFRAAFDGFDPERVAAYGDADTARLLADAGIVRNRAKIAATIANAGAVLRLTVCVVPHKRRINRPLPQAVLTPTAWSPLSVPGVSLPPPPQDFHPAIHPIAPDR